jgi:hypothetical protein
MVDRESTALLVERAFLLAEQCSSVEEVRLRLLAEGYFSVGPRLRLKHVKRELISRLLID